MKKLVKTLAIILLSSTGIIAQLSEGGLPRSFEKNFKTEKSSVPIITLPEIDTKKLLLEDSKKTDRFGKLKPFRFGIPINVDINLKNSGKWETLPDGGKLWRLSIHSKDAYSLGINFNRYYLPNGAKLFIYNENKTHVLGAFTNKNNKQSRNLATSQVNGHTITIEYFQPKDVEFDGILSFNKVIHDYKNFQKALSGSCNVDVNCPEGDTWQDEKRSVCKITYNGWLCSGALINNTSKDEVPYFLTANHCIDNQIDATDAVFYFNYERDTCNSLVIPPEQSISGSTLVATAPNNQLDFSLLQISTNPPDTFNAYFAGWNRRTTPASESTCIHHPSGDYKKISYNDDSLTTADYGSGYDLNSHWEVDNWEIGTTEGGSSGSPLFDQNHLIVGDLTGGTASCTSLTYDLYAKFDRSWDDYPSKDEQLKYWLDFYSKEPDTLLGYDPNIADGTENVLLLKIIGPTDSLPNVNYLYPKVVFKNKGNNNLTSLDISYTVDEDSLKSITWNCDLSFNEIDTATLPALYPVYGGHSFKVWSSSPNGQTDFNTSNDTLNSTFFATFDIDAAVSEIRTPNGIYCNQNTFEPEVEITNLGLGTLTSLSVEYQINEGTIVPLPWSGSLGYLESIIISFPEITVPDGDYTFNAFVSDPNGLTDMSPTNDSLSKDFSLKSGEEIRVIVQTDDSGSQTGWNIINSQNDTIEKEFSFSNYLYTYRDICLEEDCYAFDIYDNQGDGIVNYALVNLTSSDTISQGGDFGSKDSTEFCIPMLKIDFTTDTLTADYGGAINFENLSLVHEETVSYSWIFENGTPATSNERSVRVTYNVDGVFDVSLTITDGIHILTDNRPDYITILRSPLGINDDLNSSIMVYPIPSKTGLVNIKSEFAIINSYEIYDILGQKIMSNNTANNNLTINIDKQGIFILKLNTDKGEYLKKLVITQ